MKTETRPSPVEAAIQAMAASLAIAYGNPVSFSTLKREYAKNLQAIADLSAQHAREAERERVAKFVHWHADTPRGSLVADSRVAYEAQERVLRQLGEYLDGDEYLGVCVDFSQEG